MKVRYKGETTIFLTKGKKYKVISECNNHYLILDDEGDKVTKYKERFEVVKSKQLRVGDILLAKHLSEWCNAGENFFLSEWKVSEWWPITVGNRTIEEIGIKDGHKAFLVSGSRTFDVWIRAKGFRKFCKTNK